MIDAAIARDALMLVCSVFIGVPLLMGALYWRIHRCS